MPRNIPAEAINTIAQTNGIEPVNIIRVQWVKGGGYFYYSDRNIPDQKQYQGKLLDLAGLEAVLDVSQGSSSVSVKVTLNDTDGTIKKIFDEHDIINRPVVIYQWFTDISSVYKFQIYSGVVSTPVEWNEGDRSISFDVMTRLVDTNVGFTVEDGDFTNVPDLIIGKPWPIMFGTVLDMPTLQMDDMPTGTTLVDIGIPDFNLARQSAYQNFKASDNAAKGTCFSLRGAEMMEQAIINHDTELFQRGQALQRQAEGMFNSANSNAYQANRFNGILSDQSKYDLSVIPIINGKFFHQNTPIEILINSASYVGVFQGDNFVVSSRQAPDEAIPKTPGQYTNPNPQPGLVVQDTQEYADKILSNMIFSGSLIETADTSSAESQAYWNCEPPYFQSFIPPTINQADKVGEQKTGQMFFAAAGASVSVGASYPIRYILSIIPHTQVLWLSSKRTVNGFKVITPIPPSYYTLSTLTLGDITAIIATFPQPLSTMKTVDPTNMQDWSNDVYATLTSPIGPNVVDIMTWLIQTYTEFKIDNDSFNHVRTRVDKYPANFALLDTRNVVELLKDIAWQSRCAIWISDDTFFLKYLPEQYASVATISEDDIEQQTLTVGCTGIENVVTKFIATWRATYSQDKDDKIILKYNVNKYGTIEKTYNFYIFNSVELVLKSATFWTIRYANIWKTLKCKAFLSMLAAETMDNITVALTNPFIATESVVGVVNQATFNSGDFSIDMDIWLPVRMGEMTQYVFAYPADIAITYVWPSIQEIAGQFTSDVPQQASGNLGGTFQTVPAKRLGSSKTAQARPSDTFDTPENNNTPPILETTVEGNPYGDSVVISPAGVINTGVRTGTGAQSRYDYQFRSNQTINNPNEQPRSVKVYQGVVLGPAGSSKFSIGIYLKGMDQPATPTAARILGVDTVEEIVTGTTGVAYRVQKNINGVISNEWYFTPAGLWVGDSPT